jgi:phosphoribosylformylglycinamidine cyclo-ligase
VKVKGAVHITGDAYMKFNNLVSVSPGIGFEFNNFEPQPIFGLIQKTAAELGFTVTDEEMFKTFNMGWGFGIIVNKKEIDKAMNTLEQGDIKPEIIGKVTDKQIIEIKYQNKKLILT